MTASGSGPDSLAEAILLDFQTGETTRFPRTDIDRMARQYLHLTVRYVPLSDDRSLLGLTAYDRTMVTVTVGGRQEALQLDRDTVLLEAFFLSQQPKAAKKERLSKQRRFTLAHECAHQILFRLEPEPIRQALQDRYAERRLYSCRDLKAKEGWKERQANALGAALLIPRMYVLQYFEEFRRNEPLTSYGGKYNTRDRLTMSHLTGFFGVSARSVEIRLKGLGLLEELPAWLYCDPFDIQGGVFD